MSIRGDSAGGGRRSSRTWNGRIGASSLASIASAFQSEFLRHGQTVSTEEPGRPATADDGCSARRISSSAFRHCPRALSRWPASPRLCPTSIAAKLEKQLIVEGRGDDAERCALSVLNHFSRVFPQASPDVSRVLSFFENLEVNLKICSEKETTSAFTQLQLEDQQRQKEYEYVCAKWKTVANSATEIANELVLWMQAEHENIVANTVPQLKAMHAAAAVLVREDERMASLKRRVAHLEERREDVGKKITHVRRRQVMCQHLNRTNFALMDEIGILKEILRRTEMKLQQAIENDEKEVYDHVSVEKNRARTVADLELRQRKLIEQERRAAMQIDEEYKNEDFLRRRIAMAKEKAESEIIERSGSLTPRPEWEHLDIPDSFSAQTAEVKSTAGKVAQLASLVEHQTTTARYLQEEVMKCKKLCSGVMENSLTICGYPPAMAASLTSKFEQHYIPPPNFTLPSLPVPFTTDADVASQALWLWRHLIRLMGDAPIGDSTALLLDSAKTLFSPLLRRRSSVFLLGTFLEQAGLGVGENQATEMATNQTDDNATTLIDPPLSSSVQRPEEDIISDTMHASARCSLGSCVVGYLASRVFTNKLPARLYDIAAVTMDTIEKQIANANPEKKTVVSSVTVAQCVWNAYAQRRLNAVQTAEACHTIVEQLLIEIGPPNEFSWESHRAFSRLFSVVLRHAYEEQIQLTEKLREVVLSHTVITDKGIPEYAVSKLQLELGMQSLEFLAVEGGGGGNTPPPMTTQESKTSPRTTPEPSRSPPALTLTASELSLPLHINSALLIEHLAGSFHRHRGAELFCGCASDSRGAKQQEKEKQDKPSSPTRPDRAIEPFDLTLKDAVVAQQRSGQQSSLGNVRDSAARQLLTEHDDFVDASLVFAKVVQLPLRLYLR